MKMRVLKEREQLRLRRADNRRLRRCVEEQMT